MSGRYPSDWNSRRSKVLRRDNYTCQNCGRQGGSNGSAELHVHHSVPISKGGTHQLSNLITHCKDCHNAIHGNRMAPTSTQPTNREPDIDIRGEIVSSLKILIWLGWFFVLITAAGPAGLPIYIVTWFVFRYYFDPFSFQETDDESSPNPNKRTKPGSIASTNPHSSSKPMRRYTEHGKYEPSWSSTKSEEDWGIEGYDPDRDPYAWDDTLADNASSGSTEHDPESELEDEGSDVSGESADQETPFDWYGDDEVPVEIVLDHIDVDIDRDTRENIKQSVQKHRARGDAIDAADIRWIAEASEELDLEGDHPF